MTVEKNAFFRAVALRLCGTLDIEKALWECLLYLREVLPADEILVIDYDEDAGLAEVLASADSNGGQVRNVKLALAPEVRKVLAESRRRPKPALQIGEHVYLPPVQPESPLPALKAFVWDDEGAVPVHLPRRAHVLVAEDSSSLVLGGLAQTVGGLGRVLGWPPSSLMLGMLFLDEKSIGVILVRAAGKGLYTAEHAELWALLNEPASIALSNYRRYLEMLRLQNLLSQENRDLRERLKEHPPDEIIGADLGLREVMSKVERVAHLDSPVLLVGETGTGKELLVRAIARRSLRAEGPLVAVNCGAIPETLFDSELFGHERGAFTGAVTQRKGFFERADGGTIFLDEVGELPLEAQTRLLRVLQERQFERVGGIQTVSVDIRIIAATHRDLPQMVSEGRFREDLYFRLSVFPIAVPPLRERTEDIPALVDHFLQSKGRQMALGFLPSLAPGALDRLVSYAWPGNVRELENAVERALILSRGEPLAFEELGGGCVSTVPTPRADDAGVVPLRQTEAATIRRALAASGGRVEGPGGAAELLGIHPGTLRHRMRKLGVPFGRNAKPVA